MSAISALIYLKVGAYRSIICEVIQNALQMQVLITYLASQVFFYDPRFPLSNNSTAIGDVGLFLVNISAFIIFVCWVAKFVTASMLLDDPRWDTSGFRRWAEQG